MKIYTAETLRNEKNNLYPKVTEILSKQILLQATSRDHVMCKFANNKRLNDGFISCDCLYGDIDNPDDDPSTWMTLTKFQLMFQDYEFYIATSKSHRKEKNGKTARDKFHVYFPIKEITDYNQLVLWLKKLTGKYKFFDQQVKDAARFFFGNPDATIIYHGGKSILSDLYGFEVEKQGKVRTDREFIDEIKPGERNGYLFKLGCKYISEGFRETDVERMVGQANDVLAEPIEQNELNTLLKSISKYYSGDSNEGYKVIRNYTVKQIEIEDKDGNKIKRNIREEKLNYTSDMDEPINIFSSFRDMVGKKYMFENTRPSYFLDDQNEFHTRLVANNYLTQFDKGMELTATRYFKHIKDILKGYERFSCLPELNSKDDTFYLPEDIKPENTGWFKKMLDVMTFESDVDRYRFAAGLLSGFLNSSFDGAKPLFAVIAPSKSSGKTAMVRTGIQVVQGEAPLEFIGDDKDEGQVSGLRALKNKFVLYDNLQYTNWKQMLKITTAVTDTYIPAWFMNVSHTRVRNNKTFFATFNSENAFNDDILNRLVVVRAKDGRDTTAEKKAEIAKMMDGFINNREKVLADILYYIGLYDGKKDVKVLRHSKFAKWSEVMAKLLSNIYMEIDEFDFCLSDDDENLSNEMVMAKDFMDNILGSENDKFITNDAMLEKYRLFYGDGRVTTTAVSRRLSNISKSLKKYDVAKEVKFINGKTVRGWYIKRLESI